MSRKDKWWFERAMPEIEVMQGFQLLLIAGPQVCSWE